MRLEPLPPVLLVASALHWLQADWALNGDLPIPTKIMHFGSLLEGCRRPETGPILLPHPTLPCPHGKLSRPLGIIEIRSTFGAAAGATTFALWGIVLAVRELELCNASHRPARTDIGSPMSLCAVPQHFNAATHVSSPMRKYCGTTARIRLPVPNLCSGCWGYQKPPSQPPH